MPLEVECHTVPHLKALTGVIEQRSFHGQASIFRWKKISLKSTHFTSYTDQTAVSFDRVCIATSSVLKSKIFLLEKSLDEHKY